MPCGRPWAFRVARADRARGPVGSPLPMEVNPTRRYPAPSGHGQGCQWRGTSVSTSHTCRSSRPTSGDPTLARPRVALPAPDSATSTSTSPPRRDLSVSATKSDQRRQLVQGRQAARAPALAMPPELLPGTAPRTSPTLVSTEQLHVRMRTRHNGCRFAVRSTLDPKSSEESNAPRVRCWRQRRRGGSGGVVADIAKLSVGREEYYTRELATDHQAYLSGHGESPGRWYGAGATSLGLEGEASPAGFQAMFEGRHPTTGELLGRRHGRYAVPAFDVVLRPTKSVSILYALGDRATGRAVLAAHHAGLAEAVGYLDEHLGARRGHGGVQHVSGQGVLAVGFDHRTSREGDPLLHTHLVAANRVQGPDGRWTALDGGALYW